MNRVVGLLAASFCLVASSSAAAQDMNPTTAPTGAGQHEGFYGRVNLNAGYLSLSNSDADSSISGLGTGFSLAAGHSVMKNLYLFAEFNYDLALSPSLSVGGNDAGDELDLSMSFLSVGPGAAYYLPNDIYLSAMVGYTSASVGIGDADSDAATGFGLKIGAGKEWAMADQFNLGVGANFFFGSVSVEDSDSSSTPMGIGLALSGRYN